MTGMGEKGSCIKFLSEGGKVPLEELEEKGGKGVRGEGGEVLPDLLRFLTSPS